MSGRPAGLPSVLALLATLVAGPAPAHLVYQRASLHRLVADADLVARGRILDAGGWLVVEDPPLRRPVVATRRAREALEAAAASHPAPDLRRRARAQLRVLAQRK